MEGAVEDLEPDVFNVEKLKFLSTSVMEQIQMRYPFNLKLEKNQIQESINSHFISYSINKCFNSVQFSSVAQSCPTLCDPMNCSMPGLPVHHQLPESIELVMPSSHLTLCHPLLLLPPIPPSIRVFSDESTLHMRWPKYWSFSFSIIPSKEIPGPLWIAHSV